MAHGGMIGRQQQTTTLVPEHIMGKAVLKMSLQEAQQFVETQFAENPALVLEEDSTCSVCGCTLVGNRCPACGSTKMEAGSNPESDFDEWQEGEWTSSGHGDDEYFEPFSVVAAPKSLSEHLKEQARLCFDDDELPIAEFLIDCLDDDGYLREPLVDIASRFGVSVPQLEPILCEIQTFEPLGVGARDLEECLLLQLEQFPDDSPDRELAEIIVRDHWDGLSKLKLEKIAHALKADTEDISDAVAFIRDNTTPHPAEAFRDPWEGLAPRRVSRNRPDVVVYRTEDGLAAAIPDPSTGRVSIEGMYASLYSEMSQRKNGFSETDKAHVKESVMKARALIDALEFRKSSLRRITDELLAYQEGFFKEGPRALKPLTKKELAERVGLHESTVCRATQDKMIRLPSGETIEFDVIFDSALPVKELVRELAMERLSDGEIAERLTASGVQIARRTVAKYRDQLRVLPVEYRLA